MSEVKNYIFIYTHWQITETHGQLQSPKSVMLSAKADELMRFSAPTPQLASMKALKVGGAFSFCLFFKSLLLLFYFFLFFLFYHKYSKNTQQY